MRLPILLFTLLGCLGASTQARCFSIQQSQIDSLLQILEHTPCAEATAGLHDTIQKLISRAPNPDQQLRFLRQIGSFKYCEGDLDSTIHYYHLALKVGLEHRLDSQNCQLYNRLGFYYQSRGDLDSSLFYLKESNALARKSQHHLYVGASLMGMGTVYQHQGKIDQSVEAYFAALEIAEKFEFVPLAIASKLNIATIYYDHSPEKLKSIDFLDLLQVTREINDVMREMSVLEWLGYLAADSAEYDLAVSYFKEGLQVNQQQKDLHQEVLFLQGLAYVYDLSGDNRKSIEINDEIIASVLKSGYDLYLPSMYVSNASNYLALKDYHHVIKEGNKAIDAGVATGQKELYYKVLGHMAKAYEQLGRFEEAYLTQAEYMALTNELFNEQKSRQITEVETKYETQKKEAEIESLSQHSQIQVLQLQKQRYGLFGLGILVLLLIGSAFLLYRQRILKEKQRLTAIELDETKKRLKIEQQFRASELKALRSQMNPHFVFNALNSIQEYIMLNEKKLAGKYLGKFADLMRTYLDHSQCKAVTVREELDALNLYLELEKLRFEDSLEYIIDVDELIDPEEVKLPALLIQPFVENALKHGLLHKKKERKLRVDFTLHGEVLVCTIVDNGIGRQASAELNKQHSPRHKSYATGAINERIELINYSLTQPVTVETTDILSEVGVVVGTEVKLFIPAEEFAQLEI